MAAYDPNEKEDFDEVPKSDIPAYMRSSQSELEDLLGKPGDEDDEDEPSQVSSFNQYSSRAPLAKPSASNVQNHKHTDEEDDEPDVDSNWLQAPAPVFKGAASEKTSLMSSSKLTESVDRLNSLEQERRSALERGKVMMQKKKDEEEALRQSKLPSVELRARVAQAEAAREASSFKSMAAELKALRNAKNKDDKK